MIKRYWPKKKFLKQPLTKIIEQDVAEIKRIAKFIADNYEEKKK